MQNQDLPLLSSPVIINQIEIYRDGGSIIMELEGSKGEVLFVRIDGRLGSNTPDRLYAYSKFPNQQEGKLVPRGEDVEGLIIAVLQKYLNGKFTIEEQDDLKNAYGQQSLSEEERKAALCASAIDRIKKPRSES